MLTVESQRDGQALALVDTRGEFVPTLAFELAASHVVGKRLLDVPEREAYDDGLDDLAEEELVEPPSALEPLRADAQLGRRCRCERRMIGGEDACAS